MTLEKKKQKKEKTYYIHVSKRGLDSVELNFISEIKHTVFFFYCGSKHDYFTLDTVEVRTPKLH